MKALIARGVRDFVITGLPEPSPKPDEVLLKPLYAGVCFTDKHRYEGAPFSPVATGVVGHEWSGEVVEVGDEVQSLRVGDRVVAGPVAGCGVCLECQSGLSTCANGTRGPSGAGFAELAVLPETACYRVSDAVTDLQSGYIEPAAVGTRAARLSGVGAGDNVVFLGAEDYGLSTFQWVRLFANIVVVADPSPARREMVQRLGGATEIIDPTVTDPVALVQELMPWGADVVYVGSEGYVPRSFEYLGEAILMARRGGTVVTVRHQGSQELSAPIGILPGPSAFTKELKLLGFGTYFGTEPLTGGRARGDYQRAIDGCATGKICGPEWQPTVVPFADINSKDDVDDIFAALPNRSAKVLLKIWGD